MNPGIRRHYSDFGTRALGFTVLTIVAIAGIIAGIFGKKLEDL